MERSFTLIGNVEAKFRELFGEHPLLVRSPGRVNLLGEHTDYNLGFVLPAAITKAIYLAATPRNNTVCRLFALDLNEEHQFTLDAIRSSEKGWPDYIMGVVDQLIKGRHVLRGFDCVFGGDIPIGAGLSSSAALEAGIAYLLNHMFELGIDNLSLVKLAQKAENEFVGVQCGIMDQYINIFGERGKVLRIDCRSLEHQHYPFDYRDVSILLFDTRISRSLAFSKYNRRRLECAEGVATIRRDHRDVGSLRDVSLDLLTEYQPQLNPVIYQRCRYVVEENARVLAACKALGRRDLKAFGVIMNQTHKGLRDDYEVSCKELDYLVQTAGYDCRVYGSRMMGAGFGGCTINLVETEAIEEISKNITEMYEKKFNLKPGIYVTSIAPGTSVVRVSEAATV
jgi:galactokinase